MTSEATQEADIVDLAHDGRGIARMDDKAVFVDGALPGEQVRIRVAKRRRNWDEAVLVQVISASPDRVVPKCAHFGICGGCALQHLAPAAQVAAKERQLLDSLERIGRVEPERIIAPLRGPHWGYRRRARLGVKYVHKKGRVLVGFRERDKPFLADIRRCEVLIERFAELPERLAALVQSLSLRQKIPQVELAAGDPPLPDRARSRSDSPAGSGSTRAAPAALVFRVLEPPGPADLAALRAFGDDNGVQVYLQSGGLDSISPLAQDYAPLEYHVDDPPITIQFGPADFIQVNQAVNASMVAAAMRLLAPTPGDAVLDLFCGLGNFTLALAARAGRVIGVEGDAALAGRARANALRNGAGNAEFQVDDLFEPRHLKPWADTSYDLVLLDPPRAGAAAILERMPQWRPRRVVYISCHPGSLARDAGALVGGQGYRLSGAGVMDMFPHTTHVESIAVFERDP